MTANGAQCAAFGPNHDMDAAHGRISTMQTIYRLAWPYSFCYSLAEFEYAMHIEYEARWIGCSLMLCYTKKGYFYLTMLLAVASKSLSCATLDARY